MLDPLLASVFGYYLEQDGYKEFAQKLTTSGCTKKADQSVQWFGSLLDEAAADAAAFTDAFFKAQQKPPPDAPKADRQSQEPEITITSLKAELKLTMTTARLCPQGSFCSKKEIIRLVEVVIHPQKGHAKVLAVFRLKLDYPQLALKNLCMEEGVNLADFVTVMHPVLQQYQELTNWLFSPNQWLRITSSEQVELNAHEDDLEKEVLGEINPIKNTKIGKFLWNKVSRPSLTNHFLCRKFGLSIETVRPYLDHLVRKFPALEDDFW